MELIRIVLLGCVFLSLEKSVSSEEIFEVKIFKSITMIPNNKESIPYLKEYPEADTDQYTEERRLQLCQTGFDHVLKHRKGKNFQFMGDKKLGKLEAYVFVNLYSSEEDVRPSTAESDSTSSSGDESDEDVEVRPAYQCPTTPPIYIHVDCDWVNRKPIWVIFEDGGEPFDVKNITEYGLLLLEDLREADAKEMENTSDGKIAHNAFDDEKLSEEQRLKMCTRVMNMASEMGAYFSNDVISRTSKYYVLVEESEEEQESDMREVLNRETDSNENPHGNLENFASGTDAEGKPNATKNDAVHDLKNESGTDTGISDGSSEETDSFTEDNLTIMKAFTCSTVPEIHINVKSLGNKKYALWALMKKNEIKKPPAFGITGYELIIANSIHRIYKKHDNRDKKWQEDNLPRSKNITELIEGLGDLEKHREVDGDLMASINKIGKFGPLLDEYMEKVSKKDAAIDVDELRENERLSICEKAMKTVFGDVKFTNGKTGKSQYYRFYKNEVYKSKDYENPNRRRRHECKEVVKAFRCPTQPTVYIRIATQFKENIVQVIILVKDLTHEFIEFK